MLLKSSLDGTPVTLALRPHSITLGFDESVVAAHRSEEAFDEKLREFGYWSGAAVACVGEAKQAEVERKVLDTFNDIARLFGTDRAFFYPAAFGNGTTRGPGGRCRG